MNKIIKDFYSDPKNGLVGATEILRKLTQQGHKVTIRQIKNVLSNVEGYTTSQPILKKFPRRKTYSNYTDELWQADLVEMDVPQGAPAKDNNGVRYLLTVIDVFSKYAFVEPLKNKTGKEVAKAFQKIFDDYQPKRIQTDNGKEFYNKDCEKLFEKYDIKHYSSNSDYKAAVVERFNRTLKMRMMKLFESTQSFRYIDNLQDLVENYNDSYHSAIKMTPEEARKNENRFDVYNNLYSDDKVKVKEKTKLKVGDFVRIPVYKNKFSKEWVGKWTHEFFKIKNINETNPITYIIEDLKDEEVKGQYYKQELLKINKKALDQPFRIDKILEVKGKGKNKQALVSYVGWPSKFNEYIPYSEAKYIDK